MSDVREASPSRHSAALIVEALASLLEAGDGMWLEHLARARLRFRLVAMPSSACIASRRAAPVSRRSIRCNGMGYYYSTTWQVLLFCFHHDDSAFSFGGLLPKGQESEIPPFAKMRFHTVLLVAALAYAAGDEEKSDEKGTYRAEFRGALHSVGSRWPSFGMHRRPLVRAPGV